MIPMRKQGETDAQYKARVDAMPGGGREPVSQLQFGYDRGGNQVSFAQSLQMRGNSGGNVQVNTLPKKLRGNDGKGGPAGSAGGRPAPGFQRNGADTGAGMDNTGRSIRYIQPSQYGLANPLDAAGRGGPAGSAGGRPNTAAGQSGGGGPKGSADGNPQQNATGTQQGMFNFQQMMNDFYKYQPKEGDTMGQMQKQAFLGNFLQSMVDSQLANMQSQFAAAIGQQNMTHVADLELRNQSSTMKDQFNYAMQNMEAQFQYGNNAANAQHDRDIAMLAATGDQQRDNMAAQGQQDRLGEITKGEQDRLRQDMVNQSQEAIQSGINDANRYVADTSADASRDVAGTQADAQRDVASTEKEAMTETQGIKTGGDIRVADIGAEAEKFSATAAADASKYGADRTVDVARVNAQGTIDNTKETGAQTRLTMGEETRQKAKDRANMHSYARSTARAM